MHEPSGSDVCADLFKLSHQGREKSMYTKPMFQQASLAQRQAHSCGCFKPSPQGCPYLNRMASRPGHDNPCPSRLLHRGCSLESSNKQTLHTQQRREHGTTTWFFLPTAPETTLHPLATVCSVCRKILPAPSQPDATSIDTGQGKRRRSGGNREELVWSCKCQCVPLAGLL